jgi:tetratricopeptide (TPR) repeat protein
MGEISRAAELFASALTAHSTAALVCSLGELLISQGKLNETRSLYSQHLEKLTKEKDRIEVYLASAWLEERYFHDVERAKALLNVALELNPGSSLANVALARFEGRMQQRNTDGSASHNATAKRLEDACKQIEQSDSLPHDPTDGRVFNALAQIEVKAKRFRNAREVLQRGMLKYPKDHAVRLFRVAMATSLQGHPLNILFTPAISSSRQSGRTPRQLHCGTTAVRRKSTSTTLRPLFGSICTFGASTPRIRQD